MRTTAVRPYQKWSWAGDRIVEKPLIPNARMLPAITGRRPGYTRKKFDVDARQFLSIEDDTVIQTELLAMIDALKPEEQLVFGSRLRGAFDFRTRQVLQYLEGRLKYYPSGKTFDPWLFPGETFARGGGDCEDLAFALYGMLRAAGISDYCLRVVFGRVKQENRALGRKEWDHAWVV
ncbi:MAG: transglutaminase domain-containing protein, partial [Planctomycetes bacterium]|nr:transglutaminase domain-containing protein [Planctomycetota bacterium]